MRYDVHLAFFSVFWALGCSGESNFTKETSTSNVCQKWKTVWVCKGSTLRSIPLNLTVETGMSLSIKNAFIEVLDRGSLTPYANVLRELELEFLSQLHTIEPGIFNNADKLERIYIADAKRLTYIHEEVFEVYLPKLKSLRIINSGLQIVPYLGKLTTDNMINRVDFENNKISRIPEHRLNNINVKDLSLKYNEIQSIHKMAFKGSRITHLSLFGNEKLTNIDKEAFVGTNYITEITLSNTSIKKLPTAGLKETVILRIENTMTFREFPPLNNLSKLKEAHLTYPYHCCAFKLPEKHDPEGYKKMIDELEKIKEQYHKKICDKKKPGKNFTDCIARVENFRINIKDVICSPKPNAFSPCEDIMGNWWLRVMIWFVAIMAIVGNLAVIIVLVSKSSTTVPEFLMCNLAFPDLCMGIYLIMIANVDARSIGTYFNEAITWQSSVGCKVAGFLTVFSTELSVFALMVMSSERCYTILNAMYSKRLGLKTAAGIMLVGWIYAGSMAALPLSGISGYDKTSLCLPLDQSNTADLSYLSIILLFNCISFLIIVVSYVRVYFSFKQRPEFDFTSSARLERKLARKMATLIFLSFACWAPIAFFGITALAGYPLIDLTKTKYVLVFFYPLNSFVNPIVYVLLTRQYREAALALYNSLRDKLTSGKLGGIRNLSSKRSTYYSDRARTSRTFPDGSSPVTLSNNLNGSSQSAKNGVDSPDKKKVDMKEIDDVAGETAAASSGIATTST